MNVIPLPVQTVEAHAGQSQVESLLTENNELRRTIASLTFVKGRMTLRLRMLAHVHAVFLLCQHNKALAARELGVSRSTLYRLLAEADTQGVCS